MGWTVEVSDYREGKHDESQGGGDWVNNKKVRKSGTGGSGE